MVLIVTKMSDTYLLR